MTINKRAVRSIKKNISFYIISIILTTLTSLVIVGAISTGHTLKNVVNDFVEKYKAEDAEFVTYKPISDEDIKKLEKEYDVLVEYSRYKDIKCKGGDLKGTTLRVFDMPEKLNLCEIREGHKPGTGRDTSDAGFCRYPWHQGRGYDFLRKVFISGVCIYHKVRLHLYAGKAIRLH